MEKSNVNKFLASKFFFQTVESELICSTAYVELFLRQISEPALLSVFLRFIFTDNCDGKSIIDTLTDRLALQSKVRILTSLAYRSIQTLNLFMLQVFVTSLPYSPSKWWHTTPGIMLIYCNQHNIHVIHLIPLAYKKHLDSIYSCYKAHQQSLAD
jgi:hypothetical protein